MRFAGKLRRGQSGQSIVEGTMCLLVICLVLFSLLQIFYVSVAQMVVDFAAFQSARSKAVGFSDTFVNRRGRIYSIGASGQLVTPNNMSAMPVDQFPAEKILIQDYSMGVRWIEYEYWYGNNDYGTVLSVADSSSDTATSETVSFSRYPLNFPMKGAFTDSDTVTVGGSSQMSYYAKEYTDESSE